MIRVGISWRLPALLLALGAAAEAQEDFIRHPGAEFGVGARAIGMGGAFTAVGDDYTASYWNPAALAQIRRFEVLASLSHSLLENNASGVGLRVKDEASFTRVNSLGFAYPVPTYRGSLVFSVGYNRLKPYDSNLSFEWFNNTANDSVQQSWSELEEGSLNNWIFAGAVDVAPNLSVGASLNYWTGKDDYQFSFVEQDNLDIYTLRNFRLDDNIVSEFRGFNLKLGSLYHLNSNLRLGATIAIPTTFKVTENWTTDSETRFDDGSREPSSTQGSFEYHIRSPFAFAAGASLNLAGLLLAGSAEFIDWSQTRYTTSPPIEGLSKNKANEEIARNYRGVARLRAGAEFTLPGLGMQIRAGYFLDPSPLADSPRDADREFLTYGIGFLLNKQVKFDVAYIDGSYRLYNPPLSDDFTDDRNLIDYDDDIPINEKLSVKKVVATIAFRL